MASPLHVVIVASNDSGSRADSANWGVWFAPLGLVGMVKAAWIDGTAIAQHTSFMTSENNSDSKGSRTIRDVALHREEMGGC